MSNFSRKPVCLVLGAAFALSGMAAQASVFQATDLDAGYMVASAGEGKCDEGKCGEGKGAKMSPADKFKKMDANGDGSLSMAEFEAGHKGMEGKCGEGKCGEKK